MTQRLLTMLRHRHSFFPLILALLTLALVIFMFYAFTGRITQNPTVRGELPPVSSSEYDESLRELMANFSAAYGEEEDELTRLVLTEKTLTQLLSLRVPAESKERHLALAVDLNRLAQALKQRDGEEAEAAYAEMASLRSP